MSDYDDEHKRYYDELWKKEWERMDRERREEQERRDREFNYAMIALLEESRKKAARQNSKPSFAAEKDDNETPHDNRNHHPARESGNSSSSNNEGCFVTTAAYGSFDHPMVKEFRAFRDNILSKSEAGRSLISWYYKEGPAYAKRIDGKKPLQLAARIALTPLALAALVLRKTLRQPAPK